MPKPKCAACWGHHPLNLCCCCTKGIEQRPSAVSRNTKLGTCPRRICRAAVQKTRRCQWTYSFEAECLLFALPQPPYVYADRGELCQGLIGDHIPSILPGQVSEHTPEEALVILEQMGGDIKTGPAFADLLLKSDDKLAFMKRVKPYMWVGMEGGIRSSFCSGVPLEPLGTCPSCQQLQKVISSGITVGSHVSLMHE